MTLNDTSNKTAVQEGTAPRKAPPKPTGSRKPLTDAESRPQKKL